MGGNLSHDEYYEAVVWSPVVNTRLSWKYENSDEFRDERGKTNKVVSRRSFFNIILKEFTPERFEFLIEAGGAIHTFAKYMRKADIAGNIDMPLTFEHLEDEMGGYVRDLVPDPRLDPVSYPPVNK
jgi:hypothetical protein